MREVAIVNPLRTAVGSFGGSLKDVAAAELGAIVIKAILEQTGVEQMAEFFRETKGATLKPGFEDLVDMSFLKELIM